MVTSTRKPRKLPKSESSSFLEPYFKLSYEILLMDVLFDRLLLKLRSLQLDPALSSLFRL